MVKKKTLQIISSFEGTHWAKGFRPLKIATALTRTDKNAWKTPTLEEIRNDRKEAEANAKLMAAAPELLKALSEITKITGADDIYPETPVGNTNGCACIDTREKIVWRGSFLQKLENAKKVIAEVTSE